MQTKVSGLDEGGVIDMTRFGAAIRAKRGEKTLREIGAELGIGWSRLSAYEREEDQPGLSHFVRICRWLSVPMEYFTTTQPLTNHKHETA